MAKILFNFGIAAGAAVECTISTSGNFIYLSIATTKGCCDFGIGPRK